MAVKKRAPSGRELSLFNREVIAISFLGIGFFISLSLLSYNPLDPSFFGLSTGKVIHNWAGIVGAYLSDFLVMVFGGASYFIGGFFLLLAVLFFAGVRRTLSVYEIPVALVFVVFIAVLFQLSVDELLFDTVKLQAGGIVGGVAARYGSSWLGRTGTYFLVVLGSLLTFVLATRISIARLSAWIVKKATPVIRSLTGKGVILLARAQRWAVKSWENRQAAKAVFKREDPQIHLEKKPPAPIHLSAPSESLKEVPPIPPVPRSIPPPPIGDEPKILQRADRAQKKNVSPQLEFQNLSGKGHELPPLNLLDSETREETPVDTESLKMNARILEKKLLDFGVDGRVTEIHPGPVITMYEFQPAAGIKLSRIANLVDDLSLVMEGRSVRIVAPLPNKPAVGIEIPNNTRETVWLKDIIADQKFQRSESKLVMALGKDIEGVPFVADLSKMPHLLVAGATGSGKSVSINAMILSLLYKAKPDEVRLIMVDPKMLELSMYEGIPHLLLPVVTEPKKAALALRWAVMEMERRYRLLADLSARHIVNYNKKIEKGEHLERQGEMKDPPPEGDADPIRHEGKLPFIVILIDELADLMMVSSREVEESIMRLAQMARAAGIHLIVATQRPSVDVITGIIKANFPARISFKVSSKHDSRTVIDTIGSERLLGNGDMLFVPPGASKMLRVHGAFITESEVARVVDFLKKQAKPVYDESILKVAATTAEGGEGEDGAEADNLYDQAVAIVAEARQASISMIQRKLRVGYNRAARMIEKMETEGIVSPPNTMGHRQVLVSTFQSAG